MKKLVITLLLAGVVSVPLAAADNAPQAFPKAGVQDMQKGHEAFRKAHQEQRAKMKATQEKMEKLVKEYNKLKDGKKKDAKRAEIEKEVGAIHQEQLKFKQEQLMKFEQRLNAMKEQFQTESSDESQKAWVEQKTEKLIKYDGNLRVLFDPRDARGPHMGGKGPHGRMHGKFGPKGHGDFGPQPGPRPAPEAAQPLEAQPLEAGK